MRVCELLPTLFSGTCVAVATSLRDKPLCTGYASDLTASGMFAGSRIRNIIPENIEGENGIRILVTDGGVSR